LYKLFSSILSEDTVENQTLEYLVSQLHQFFKREDNFKGDIFIKCIEMYVLLLAGNFLLNNCSSDMCAIIVFQVNEIM